MINIEHILKSSKNGRVNRTKEDVLIKLFEEIGEVSQEIGKDLLSSYREYDKEKVNEEIVDSLISLVDLLYVVNEGEINYGEINKVLIVKCGKWVKNSHKTNIKQIIRNNSIGMILASDLGYGIGYKNNLPWERIKLDMQHFKNTTFNKIVIMGANTYKSFNEKPLKNRYNIIVSNNTYKPDNTEFGKIHPNIKNEDGFTIFVKDLKDAFIASTMIIDTNPLNFDIKETNVWIIGGAKLYESSKEFVDTGYITNVHESFTNDTMFDYHNNFINGELFKIIETKSYTKSETGNYDITIDKFKKI